MKYAVTENDNCFNNILLCFSYITRVSKHDKNNVTTYDTGLILISSIDVYKASGM